MKIAKTFSRAQALALICSAIAASAEAEVRPSLSLGGVTGLIDMPSGEQQSDGMLSFSKSRFGPIGRTTLSFQISPRLSGSFRYSAVHDWNSVVKLATTPGSAIKDFTTYYDRSFDLRYQLTEEGRYVPAITVGLQDFIGTGLYAGEFVAATKNFGEKLKVTAGLGWGRFGSYGSIGAPFGSRPTVVIGQGGNLRFGEWFKGDAAPFGGIEYAATDRLTFKAEYSSDAYLEEASKRKTFDRKSPLNFGVEYRSKRGPVFGLYSLYGSQVGFSVNILLDPKRSPSGGQVGAGPLPVRASAKAQGWTDATVDDAATKTKLRDQVQKILTNDGIVIEAMSINAATVQLRMRNTQIDNSAQAVGRTARALAYVMPASIKTFEIVPVKQGVGLSKVVIQRADLEDLEFASGQDSILRDRVLVLPVSGRAPAGSVLGDRLYPKLSWGIAPYVTTSLFDPDSPLQASLGLRLAGRYEFAPGLVLSGSVTKTLLGNFDGSKRLSDSKAKHRVRSEAYLYADAGDPAIESLTMAWYAKPTDSIYTRVTAGYLEPMYAGISSEVLWQQVNKPYALGVELNYVKQRDFNQLFGLQDYSTFTGHVSGYYHFKNGFQAQLDVGRYLAGDVGATFALDREFANGIKVGAFATLTNMSFSEFGEGSFDKGIRIEVPFAWLTGRPTQKANALVLRPLLRDGGAKLNVDGRLYPTVRSNQQSDLDAAWGRFWK